ncbi:uncharacterized protein LOC128185240 [Crassostrea angulata]|uniref:uncharacterized protein LOC128185240 n=1 Tax=Magallana angulata TaxID=2784310 RepID=UPI0022B2029B|nr:uncharacterized protein LOC128185240 [Crassostrea angulata]
MIESLPAPYHVQWSAKNKDDEHFTPIDIYTEEYEGTTVSFPHPVLVVRQKDQLENNYFRIEVTNFIGKTVHEISDNVKETPYNDHGASVRFTRLNNILADEFPLEKVEKLKFVLKSKWLFLFN